MNNKKELHPEYNFAHLEYWASKHYHLMADRDQGVNEHGKRADPGSHNWDVMQDEIDECAEYFTGYFKQGHSAAIELIKRDFNLLEYATDEQKDNEAIILEFAKQANKQGVLEQMGTWYDFYDFPIISQRLQEKFKGKFLADVQEQIENEQKILKERHHLESITTKPRFAFDFSPKPAIVKEAPKPKMRMKI